MPISDQTHMGVHWLDVGERCFHLQVMWSQVEGFKE